MYRYRISFSLIILILFYLGPQLLLNDILAQVATPKGLDGNAKIKAVFLYNFTRYFEWPNIENENEFRFGILSSNEALINELRNLASKKKVGSAEIKILVFDSISAMTKTEILYVDASEFPDFILNKQTRNTLVVTERERDLFNTMISFAKIDGKVKFALNKITIGESGLKMHPDFELLAAAVIRSKEEQSKGFNSNSIEIAKWDAVFNKLKSSTNDNSGIAFTKQEIEQVLGKFNEQSTKIDSQNQSILQQTKQIEEQRATILLQEKRLSQQLFEIGQQENRLKVIQTSLNQTTEQSKIQSQLLETRKAELALQQRRIRDQKGILDKQKDNIESQSKKLFLQLEQINMQRTFLWMSLGFVLITIFFLIVVYRNYKKIQSVNALLEIQKTEITNQKYLIEEKHREITDSINYAERIQRALLASNKVLESNLNDYFIVFKPKDVVSGDFYWASKLSNGNFILVTADSTGHGVPGAIMSILNMACLKESVIQGILRPDFILNETRRLIIESLANDGSVEGGKDGMDASAVSFDFTNMKIYCASAFNPVWIVRGGIVNEIEADRMPVGRHELDQVQFALQSVDIQKGDVVYCLTDGYADQFGGPKSKKFMYKRLKDFLAINASLPMTEQKELLILEFNTWKGELEQVDDVTIIGIRV